MGQDVDIELALSLIFFICSLITIYRTCLKKVRLKIKDEQWDMAQLLLPKPVKQADGNDRSRANDRVILDDIL